MKIKFIAVKREEPFGEITVYLHFENDVELKVPARLIEDKAYRKLVERTLVDRQNQYTALRLDGSIYYDRGSIKTVARYVAPFVPTLEEDDVLSAITPED